MIEPRPNPPTMSSPDLAIQQGATHLGLTPVKTIQPVWARITKVDDEVAKHEWEMVFVDPAQKWDTVDLAPYGSYVDEAESASEETVLYDPAVEVNSRPVPVGSIVRLYPHQDAFPIERDGKYSSSRFWLFSFDQGLRPFVLAQDVIPSRATGPGDNTQIYDYTAQAKWLDEPGATVTLYSAHVSGWPSWDGIISLGVGRGPGMYFRGTYGWARYTPQGTRIGSDDDGNPEWRGEWQIVTLYAETIMRGRVTDTGGVSARGIGQANLWWINKDQQVEESEVSGYNVVFLNDLQVELDYDDEIVLYYNRNVAIWMTLRLPAPAFVSAYAYADVQTTGIGNDGVDVLVPIDTEIFADENPIASEYYAQTGGDTGHSLELDKVNKGIKNIGNINLVVNVSWTVTAQRVITDLDVDVDSYCQVRLKNNGVTVDGVSTRMSSSRRAAPTATGEGNLAVNSVSGNTRQLLKPDELLTLWIHKNLSYLSGLGGEAPNDWETTATMCHMTVETVEGVVFEELP